MGRCVQKRNVKLVLEVKACRSMPMELDCGICGSSVFFLFMMSCCRGGRSRRLSGGDAGDAVTVGVKTTGVISKSETPSPEKKNKRKLGPHKKHLSNPGRAWQEWDECQLKKLM